MEIEFAVVVWNRGAEPMVCRAKDARVTCREIDAAAIDEAVRMFRKYLEQAAKEVSDGM